ncbi:type II toxin-antitoxin system HicB family antitoxin [Paraburkholderia caballeronis]|uniref:type II toxin-antitoxin system HicB family antitoxin n=1 Tax=Paraburkholderia caballeronis TaxID=416943 RepID=UPI001416FA38|nr:type II toxin-antitoxin system HicB family antitoxin [Paraburkholderia caballeronis]
MKRNDHLKYPALIEKENEEFIVTFRDFPNIRSRGKTIDIAKAYAIDALLYAFEDSFLNGRKIPKASHQKKGDVIIEVPLSASRKIKMLNSNAIRNEL